MTKRSRKMEEGTDDRVEVINNKETKKEHDKNKKSKIKVLVFLILIIIIVDLSTFFYYLYPIPNFNDFSDNSGDNKELICKDGTPNEKCSQEKPYYCYNGELVKKAFTCGCPKGYKVDFQDCKKI